MLLGVPTMMLVLYGYAINFDVRHVPLGGARPRQERAQPRPRRLLPELHLLRPARGRLGGRRPGAAPAKRAPPGPCWSSPKALARGIAEGRRVTVQLLVDGADANTATTLLGYAAAIASEVNVEVAGRGPRAPARAARPTTSRGSSTTPSCAPPSSWCPGLIGFILMLTAVLSTALAVVREKERGTMEQLRVTSLRPGELVVGKILPYLLISLGAAVLIVVAARVLFGVAVRGPYLALLVATFIYLVGALGFGLLVSSVAESQAMAFQVGMVSSMLPAIFLSGFIFPIRAMPLRPAGPHLRGARPLLQRDPARGDPEGSGPRSPTGATSAFLVLYAAVVMTIAYARLTRRET